MHGKRDRIRLSFDKRRVSGVLAALLVCASALSLRSENVTLTTSYPSPAGIYAGLTTTGNTRLARDNGTVVIGDSNPGAQLLLNGRMGIGVNSPDANARLHLGGPVKMANLAADPAGTNGAIYYNSATGKFRGYSGGSWGDLSIGSFVTSRFSRTLGPNTSSTYTCPGQRKVLSCWTYAVPSGNNVCNTNTSADGRTCSYGGCGVYNYRTDIICGGIE